MPRSLSLEVVIAGFNEGGHVKQANGTGKGSIPDWVLWLIPPQLSNPQVALCGVWTETQNPNTFAQGLSES